MKKLLKKLLPRRSKQGVTLVESVIAVVVLGMFATGVLSLLTTGGAKIMEISGESANYAEATQKLDLVISAISNGAIVVVENEDDGTLSLNTDGLTSALGYDVTPVDIGFTASHDGMKLTATASRHSDGSIRGWYLTLEYGGETVTGFAGNNEGVFDK